MIKHKYPSLPKVIGLHGKIGSGKSTLAGLLVEEGFGYQKRSYGDKLKEECSRIFEIPLSYFYESKERIVYPGWTVGSILQHVGTSMREVNPSIWVDKAFEDIDLSSNRRYVFDDARLPNEVKAIQQIGGIVVRIIRPKELRKPHLAGRDPNHITETALDNVEMPTILNDGTPLELLEKLLNAILK